MRIGAGAVRHGMNLWPPFAGAGIRIQRIAPDWHEVDVGLRLRWFKAKHQANTELDSDPMYGQTTIKQDRKGAIHMEKVLNIEGMVCGMCVKHVDKALRDIQGIKDVDVSLESKSAQVKLDQDVPDAVLKAAIEDAGYQLVSIQ